MLSKHVSALSVVGYVKSHEGTHAGRRATWLSLTSKGRSALRSHVSALQDLIADMH